MMNLDRRESCSRREDDRDQLTLIRFEFLVFFARYANEPKVHSCKRTVRDSKKFRLLFLRRSGARKQRNTLAGESIVSDAS